MKNDLATAYAAKRKKVRGIGEEQSQLPDTDELLTTDMPAVEDEQPEMFTPDSDDAPNILEGIMKKIRSQHMRG